MVKLDVNSGVYTMDMWMFLDETRPVFSWQGTVSGQAAFDKPTRPAALCRGETTEDMKLEGDEETELNGVAEGQDEMKDEGDRIDGEEELAAPVWRVRAGPRNDPKPRVPFRDWCAHCVLGRGRTHHHVAKQKNQGSVEKARHRHGLLLHENEVCCECSNNLIRIDNLHCGE